MLVPILAGMIVASGSTSRAQPGVGGVHLPRHAAVRRRHRPRQADPVAPAERSDPVRPHGRGARSARSYARAQGERMSVRITEARPRDRDPVPGVVGLAAVLDVRCGTRSRRAPTSSPPSCCGGSPRSTRCSAGSCARPNRCAGACGSCSSARACSRCSRSSTRSGIFRLGGIWTPAQTSDSGSGRGGATLNSAIAVGDYLSYSLRGRARLDPARRRHPRCSIAAMAGADLPRHPRHRPVLGVDRADHRRVRRRAHRGPDAPAPQVARPRGDRRRRRGVAGRVARGSRASAAPATLLPQSWQGRIDNLTNFYMPRLAHFRWVLGIRPDTVLPAPETWRDVIYLESGYLWLFWVGGIPLVLALPLVPAQRIPRNRSSRQEPRRRHRSGRGSHSRRVVVPADPLAHRPAPHAPRRRRPVLLPARAGREPNVPPYRYR